MTALRYNSERFEDRTTDLQSADIQRSVNYAKEKRSGSYETSTVVHLYVSFEIYLFVFCFEYCFGNYIAFNDAIIKTWKTRIVVARSLRHVICCLNLMMCL